MYSIKSLLDLYSLESSAMEAKEEEIEKELYAKLSNPEELKKADRVIEQLQWMFPILNEDGSYKATMRSRREIIDGGDPEYTLTIKIYHKGDIGCTEYTCDSNEDMMEAFEAISTMGISKTRYEFPFSVEHEGEKLDLKWEVDIIKDKEGNDLEYCKIDLEVPTNDIPLPEFPLKTDEIFNYTFGENIKPEHKRLVKELFKKAELK